MDTRIRPLFHAAEELQFAWAKTRQHLRPLLLIGGLSAFLALLNASSGNREGLNLLGLVVQLLQVGLTMAWIRVALRISDGQPVEVPRARELLPDYLSFLFTSVLLGLGVSLGLLLLVVPGVLFGLAFGFAPYAVMDHKADPLSAMKESLRLTRGNRPELFAMWLVLLLLNLVGAMALGLGLLLTVPMSFIIAADVYRRLQARGGVPIPPSTQRPPFAGPPAPIAH